MNALLHVDGNGKLAELELFTIGVNDADNRVASLPKVGAATIYVAPVPWPIALDFDDASSGGESALP